MTAVVLGPTKADCEKAGCQTRLKNVKSLSRSIRLKIDQFSYKSYLKTYDGCKEGRQRSKGETSHQKIGEETGEDGEQRVARRHLEHFPY